MKTGIIDQQHKDTDFCKLKGSWDSADPWGADGGRVYSTACLALCLAPGRFVAYGQKCSHLSCAVVPHLEKGELHCPCHNGYFELNEGRPIAGPPRRPLPLVSLEIEDGVVFATGFEPRTV